MNIFEKIRLRRLDEARDQDAARLDDQRMDAEREREERRPGQKPTPAPEPEQDDELEM